MTHPDATAGILRVSKSGRVMHMNEQARALLGPCCGIACSIAVHGRSRDGSMLCNPTCTAELGPTDSRAAVVRDKPVRLTCSNVGDEVVVLVEQSVQMDPWNEPLTRREAEVLALVARGNTTPEIADVLGIRPATVRTHVEHARDKLGATTRAEAVAKALATGQIR